MGEGLTWEEGIMKEAMAMARWVGELGQEDCLFVPSKARAEQPYIAALCHLLTFCACLLEGPWEQNPCLETKKLYFRKILSIKTTGFLV